MIRLLALLLLAAPQTESGDAPTPAAILADWRADIEFDRPGEIVRERELASTPELRRNGEALALLARALRETGDLDGARTLLSAPREFDAGSNAYVVVERARQALALDDLDGAVRLLAADDDPTVVRADLVAFPQASFVLGRAHARAGRLGDAAALLRRYLEHAPIEAEVAAAWHICAREAAQRGDLQRAAQFEERGERFAGWYAYQRARRLQIEADPRAVLPRLGLAVLWLTAERPAEARVVLLELLAIEPTHCAALGHLAEAERKLGERDAAIATYARALACQDDPALRLNRALLLVEAERTGEARAELERVVAAPVAGEPRFLAAHLALARLLQAAGEEHAASERYARYRELGGDETL